MPAHMDWGVRPALGWNRLTQTSTWSVSCISASNRLQRTRPVLSRQIKQARGCCLHDALRGRGGAASHLLPLVAASAAIQLETLSVMTGIESALCNRAICVIYVSWFIQVHGRWSSINPCSRVASIRSWMNAQQESVDGLQHQRLLVKVKWHQVGTSQLQVTNEKPISTGQHAATQNCIRTKPRGTATCWEPVQ